MIILKKFIKFIIIIIVCIIVLIAILLLINNKEKYSVNTEIIERDFSIDSSVIQEVKSKNDYIDISQCVYRYFNYIREANATSLIDLLYPEYIKEQNISENDVFEYTYKCKNRNLYYFIENMYVDYNSEIIQYIVECNVSNGSKEERVFLIVLVDRVNMIFSILPIAEECQNIESVKTQKNITSINKNNNNNFIHNPINDETMCKFLLDDYINKAVHFPKKVYHSLDEEYRVKRFSEYKDFQNFIENNKNRLENSILDDIKQPSDFNNYEKYAQYLSSLDRVQLDKYLVEGGQNGKQYICMDKNECYYVFNEKASLHFTLILDTYTIPSEKFKKTYDNGNEQVKMQLNIDKFIKMLNNKDYATAYKLLDEGFRNNYFKTEDKFEEFIRSKFYEFNKVSFEKFSNEGNIFIYEIRVMNKNNLNNKGDLKINIIMKLLDNYNFVMSFGSV